jgi:hypothetical protein
VSCYSAWKDFILLNFRNYTDAEHESEEAYVDDSLYHFQLTFINFQSTYFKPINHSKTESHLHNNLNISYFRKNVLLHYEHKITNIRLD